MDSTYDQDVQDQLAAQFLRRTGTHITMRDLGGTHYFGHKDIPCQVFEITVARDNKLFQYHYHASNETFPSFSDLLWALPKYVPEDSDTFHRECPAHWSREMTERIRLDQIMQYQSVNALFADVIGDLREFEC